MNKYKITRIYMENFKHIDRAMIDMTNEDIVVLDGPNGFGKTTIFDAIELVLTGRINRIENYNKQSGFHTLLFSKDDEKDTIIKIEFVSDNDSFTFVKWYQPNEKLQMRDRKPDNWSLLYTYEMSNFDSDLKQAKKIEQQAIYELLGITNDFERFYNLFYYIQQEENTQFLKQPGKKRMETINHLFDTQVEQKEREKIAVVRTALTKEKKKVKEEKDQSKQQLDLYMGMAKEEENNEVEYMPLFKNGSEMSEVEWDKKELMIDSKEQRDKYITDLNDIKDFIENYDEFKSAQFNKEIDQITRNENLLKNSIIASNFLDTYNQIHEKYKRREVLQKTQNKLDKNMFLDNIKELNFKAIKKETKLEINYEEIEQLQNSIISQQSSASELSKIVNELNNTREQLLKHYKSVVDETNDTHGECPFCGYDWTSLENLVTAVESKRKMFIQYYDDATEAMNKIVADLYEKHIDAILEQIHEELEDEHSKIDNGFFLQLKDAISAKDKIKGFKKWCKENNIDISSYLNKEYNKQVMNIKEKIDGLADCLSQYKKKIKEGYSESDVKFKQFDNLYKDIFQKSEEQIKAITNEEVEQKKRYINYIFYRSNAIKVENEQNRFNKLEEIYNELENKISDLQDILAVYDSEIRKHWNKIMKDIEIPFYIYSGKIIQEYQKGLGLFIEEAQDGEAKSIKFVSDNEYDHDAINYLSSGQLSALVISFTLALNKVYGNQSLDLILIDDPVQTMDEINMASLTELLRNEFFHKQIIISTHEEDVSRYLRYKFKKYSLKAMKFNVKDNLVNVV